MPSLPVLIVGAGPAGLATAAELARRGVPYRLVERGDRTGFTWHNLYDSLTLHTGKHMSGLPGLSMGRATSLFPTRREFVEYLQRYQQHFGIVVETGVEVTQLERGDDTIWRARTTSGDELQASQVVMATGIVARPRLPVIPARELYRGRVLHSSEYRRPAGFEGRRVLVVGVGNSGGEIGGELARAGAQVTMLVRSGQHVVPKQIGPFPAQYVRFLVGKLPRAAQEVIFARVQRKFDRTFGPPVLPRPSHSVLDAIPLIGFTLVDAIRDGLVEVRQSAPASFTPNGMAFTDGSTGDYDVVLFATGFEAALDALGDRVRRTPKGFAVRSDRVRSADQPGLWFVGQNYDHTGGLTNIRTDARLAARAIATERR